MYCQPSNKSQSDVAFCISIVKSEVKLLLKAQSDCWLSV